MVLINSLAPERCGSNFTNLCIFHTHITSWYLSRVFLVILALLGECHWSPFGAVKHWQATSHYLSQCWTRSMSPYGITGPQWVKMPDQPGQDDGSNGTGLNGPWINFLYLLYVIIKFNQNPLVLIMISNVAGQTLLIDMANKIAPIWSMALWKLT